MTRALLGRLTRLESRATTAAESVLTLRFGNLKRLPADYKGERHVIVARELPKQGDQEWVEFEEVCGPAPESPAHTIAGRGGPLENRLDIMFVEAEPQPEETDRYG